MRRFSTSAAPKGFHGACPAQLLARLAKRVEAALGITVSIGLSDRKFLAKLASDLDKPRALCDPQPQRGAGFSCRQARFAAVGVGAAMQRRLARDGITAIGQLSELGQVELASRYGGIGRLACREDDRTVVAHSPARSISAETTLAHDEADAEVLGRILWPLCEKVSERLKQSSVAARTITLKLKTADFHVRTRSRRVADATQLADTLYFTAARLLAAEADGVTRFRLIGVGADALVDSRAADPPTLFDEPRRLKQAIDQIRG